MMVEPVDSRRRSRRLRPRSAFPSRIGRRLTGRESTCNTYPGTTSSGITGQSRLLAWIKSRPGRLRFEEVKRHDGAGGLPWDGREKLAVVGEVDMSNADVLIDEAAEALGSSAIPTYPGARRRGPNPRGNFIGSGPSCDASRGTSPSSRAGASVSAGPPGGVDIRKLAGIRRRWRLADARERQRRLSRPFGCRLCMSALGDRRLHPASSTRRSKVTNKPSPLPGYRSGSPPPTPRM